MANDCTPLNNQLAINGSPILPVLHAVIRVHDTAVVHDDMTCRVAFREKICRLSIQVARRSRSGAMPSSGQRAGANTMLSIHTPAPAPDQEDHDEARKARSVTPVSS